MKWGTVSMEVKRSLRSSILSVLMYRLKTLMWNRAWQSRLRAVEMSCLRGACGVTRWEGVSNESVCERCSMGICESGVKCGMVAWVVWPY